MFRSIRQITSVVFIVIFSLALCFGLAGCFSSPTQKQSTKQTASSSSKTRGSTEKWKRTYSDIPTLYPSLYQYDPSSALRNVYNESMVVSWDQAGNYVGKAITVEGDVDSVVHATSSKGSPYFYNIGNGGFSVVIWSENLSRFDQYTLRNDVNWSKSDQPLQIKLRASGVVEMYNGRPQITARDGTQVAEWINGGWCSMINDEMMNDLMDSLYG